MTINLMLDSGAYTAWTRNKQIDIKAYCNFLHNNLDWVTSYVSLDLIKPENPDESAKQSFVNWQYMRSQGLNPLPVFHAREKIEWLYRYLDAGCEYICLAAKYLPDATKWYEAVWPELTNSEGLPIVKCHSLGEGKTRHLMRFPWYSSDSTTWLHKGARSGEIRLPGGDDRTFGLRSDGLNREGRKDINRLDAVELASLKVLLKNIGLDELPAQNEYARTVRLYICALYYLDLERQINDLTPIKFHSNGLLTRSVNTKPSVSIPRFSLHLVTGRAPNDLAVLAAAKVRSWLISYYYIQRQEDANKIRQFIADPLDIIQKDTKANLHYAYIQNLLKQDAYANAK